MARNGRDWPRSIFLFLKSTKLTVVLLLLIIAGSILATFVPQGQNAMYYQIAYGPVVGRLIGVLHVDRFFRSFLFLFPAGLFLLNLGLCTANRLVSRIRAGRKWRFGPDILHIGLLILLVGGIITFSGRREGSFSLAVGDTALIPGGYYLKLLSFEFLTYEDGRPKAWISTVSVSRNGETKLGEFAIEVNKPLKIGNVKIYQAYYSREKSLVIADAAGALYEAGLNWAIPVGDGAFIFRDTEQTSDNTIAAVFETTEGHSATGTVQLKPNDKLGDFTITHIYDEMTTGLQAVIDPGYRIVLVALIFVIAGLSLTYLQKIGDSQQ